jgi:hypothetical protein
MTNRAEQQIQVSDHVAQNAGAFAGDGLDDARMYSLSDLNDALGQGKPDMPAQFANGDSLLNGLNGLKPSSIPPEYQQMMDATQRLDEYGDPFARPIDQRAAQNINWALVSGDSGLFGDVLRQYANNPEALRNVIDSVNHGLQNTKANLELRLNKAGDTLTLVSPHNFQALQISTDGRASVRNLTFGKDGTPTYGSHVHNLSAASQMSIMSQDAADNIMRVARGTAQRTPRGW